MVQKMNNQKTNSLKLLASHGALLLPLLINSSLDVDLPEILQYLLNNILQNL